MAKKDHRVGQNRCGLGRSFQWGINAANDALKVIYIFDA